MSSSGSDQCLSCWCVQEQLNVSIHRVDLKGFRHRCSDGSSGLWWSGDCGHGRLRQIMGNRPWQPAALSAGVEEHDRSRGWQANPGRTFWLNFTKQTKSMSESYFTLKIIFSFRSIKTFVALWLHFSDKQCQVLIAVICPDLFYLRNPKFNLFCFVCLFVVCFFGGGGVLLCFFCLVFFFFVLFVCLFCWFFICLSCWFFFFSFCFAVVFFFFSLFSNFLVPPLLQELHIFVLKHNSHRQFKTYSSSSYHMVAD